MFSTVLTPILMLAALGVGLGTLVDKGTAAHRASLDGVRYLQFLAPGLLAAAAMQTAAEENPISRTAGSASSAHHEWTSPIAVMITRNAAE